MGINRKSCVWVSLQYLVHSGKLHLRIKEYDDLVFDVPRGELCQYIHNILIFISCLPIVVGDSCKGSLPIVLPQHRDDIQLDNILRDMVLDVLPE